MSPIIQTVALYAIPMIFAITLHEAAHGYVAKYFGDYTAYQAGRISLNPINHIDPIGTVLIPVALVVFTAGQFVFGWAKPVPVNFGNLRDPKRDMLWVAAAGPGANLFMALCWALILKLVVELPVNYFSYPLQQMAKGGVLINLGLMVLNLIPIPPLDGGRIAVSLLPHRLAYRFAMIEPYGLIIIVVLLATRALGAVIWPLVTLCRNVIYALFGLS
ncbi:MAG TPA: site-2 protease family protein [Burkholderiales bacterium]|nr:site-2 protease family protein [Burkholderiales bacterium]